LNCIRVSGVAALKAGFRAHGRVNTGAKQIFDSPPHYDGSNLQSKEKMGFINSLFNR
jgi:hypothetical protein